MKRKRNHNRHPRRATKIPAHLAFQEKLKAIREDFQSFYLEEPKLVFGSGELSVDPKAGIATHGPFGWMEAPDRTIQIGVIGTGESIQSFLNFLAKCQLPVRAGFKKPKKDGTPRPLDPHTYPDFPGCSHDVAFRASFVSSKAVFHRIIHEQYIRTALSAATEEARMKSVIELLIRELKALDDLDQPPDVVVVVLPRDVEHELAHVGLAMAKRRTKLTPRQRFLGRLRKEEETGQSFLNLEFDAGSPSDVDGYWNIRHAFKARAMVASVPTQWMWESTLSDPHLSNVSWNLFTALYYKAGNAPWKLQSLPDNTCYVGVGFFKERPVGKSDMHSSLAQVFGAGEGIVLQGDKAVIDKSRGDSSPHLSEASAEGLLKRAIATYTNQHNGSPTRIVVHKTSGYWPEEIAGFKKAIGSIYRYDFLTLTERESRFMRLGAKPVLRGTVIMLGKRYYLLFTNGYVPYLRTYPSKRIPRPLEITEHHGDSTAVSVCQEILALTKLNWNSSTFGSSLPITLRFAHEVGRVLAEFPKDGSIQFKTKYRYYM